jgi:hypothetical protein
MKRPKAVMRGFDLLAAVAPLAWKIREELAGADQAVEIV